MTERDVTFNVARTIVAAHTARSELNESCAYNSGGYSLHFCWSLLHPHGLMEDFKHSTQSNDAKDRKREKMASSIVLNIYQNSPWLLKLPKRRWAWLSIKSNVEAWISCCPEIHFSSFLASPLFIVEHFVLFGGKAAKQTHRPGRSAALLDCFLMDASRRFPSSRSESKERRERDWCV